MEENEKLTAGLDAAEENSAAAAEADLENSENNNNENEEAERSEKDKKDENPSWVRDVVEIVESTLVTVFVVILIFTYLLHPVNVVGDSMNPTLINGDRVFMTTVYGKVKYGDIIIINNDMAYVFDESGNVVPKDTPLNECIIKRVIATEGQEINIDTSDSDPANWTVSVDGKVLDEPYLEDNAVTTPNNFEGKFPFTVPEGYCFVMGDNRNVSSDSRSSAVGLIKNDQIYGKAIFRYSPVSDMKFLFNSEKHSAYEDD